MRTQHVLLAAAVCIVVAVMSCNRSPAEPTPNSDTTTATRIDIDGPDVIAPDSTAQYRAIAHSTDGNNVDVTAQAIWQTSDPGVAHLTAPGVITAGHAGETAITARLQNNARAGLEVLVLQPGTYRVAGRVSESGQPVAGAAVEVIESPGVATVTDASGDYRLYGVAGDVHLRVTKDGYKPTSTTLTVAANVTLDLTIYQVSLPALDGLYSLTLTADACGIAPPNESTRTYDAQVTQDGPQLNVVLSGARFATVNDRGHGFNGRIVPDGIAFSLSGWDDYVYNGIYYNLVEVLTEGPAGPTKLLTVSGSVSATASQAGISGHLDGTIAAERMLGEYGNEGYWSCTSRKHHFALLRR